MTTTRALLAVALAATVLTGCAADRATVLQPIATPVERWLAAEPSLIAHRGGSADWPEGTTFAYDQAAAWSPDLALEAPVWLTADGVWVVCHDATTGAEFDVDLDIATSTWAQLSQLRTVDGGQPLARLSDVLAAHPDRVWLVDDKPSADVPGLLDLLDAAGGPGRFVVKGFFSGRAWTEQARARGYTTWGYYYPTNMADFAATQSAWDIVALQWDAPAADWTTALATGRRVFGHVVRDDAQAQQALAAGATGLMVAGVTEVVPR
ncbi:glycerophosphodiester phosphodiesterase [Klenkia marina]|uniref:glycerophosphodiester phosphodiesterase n=1 Tax=Klenkia marina TaxID=1960309 RepID=UPI0014022DBC|nr:glycerophosphodiester phosphodiesterase family protein [Klenkia marina]